ncbi:hypothetical protein [Confluentibacter sediminis]|uniref:hypothetical protein n=1 Tax=Confluentibacter sediminis TaxID=2219045 RepID=UPI000DACE0B3|nr:hypothetical protein [Confluentibacter sediminis]
MKKIILFLFFVVNATVFSQDIKEKIAKETCECVSKLDTDSMNSSDLELKFGLCMLDAYNMHIDEFPESERLDFGDNVQMEKFGEEIALKMLTSCPDLILKLGGSYNVSENENTDKNDSVIKGVFNGSKTGTFYNIIVKESTGKTTELIILDYFENVYLITDKLIKNNQEIEVYYYETELFDVKLNKFVSTKIVTDIIKK